jgi:pimeloyl-ACP methyl ester carboxylesterase
MGRLLAVTHHQMVELSDGFQFDTLIVNPGCARRLIFLHGLYSTPEMVGMLAPMAQRHGVTIYAPCLPCHGKSHDVSSFAEFVRRVAEWCDAMKLSHEVMFGHSVGALVLPYLARLRPDLVSAMICLAMPTRPIRGNLDLATRMLALWADSLGSQIVAALQSWHAPRGSRASEIQAPPPSFRTAKMLRILKEVPDMTKVVDQLGIPIALIYGAIDLATRPPKSRLGLPKPVILGWQSHSFPMFNHNWKPISDAITLAIEQAV